MAEVKSAWIEVERDRLAISARSAGQEAGGAQSRSCAKWEAAISARQTKRRPRRRVPVTSIDMSECSTRDRRWISRMKDRACASEYELQHATRDWIPSANRLQAHTRLQYALCGGADSFACPQSEPRGRSRRPLAELRAAESCARPPLLIGLRWPPRSRTTTQESAP